MSDKPTSEAYVPLMTDDIQSAMDSEDPESASNLSYSPHNGQILSTKNRLYNIRRDLLMPVIIFVQAIAIIALLIANKRSNLAYEKLLTRVETSEHSSHPRLYSPANAILEDQVKVFDDGFHRKNIYEEYSDRSDAAWQALYNNTLITIPKSEAALLPNRTWPIKELPGYYVGQLDVFHQLHCVNKIRQALRRDRYDQLVADPAMEFGSEHLAHCIDNLRQHVMCHSDTAVIPYVWDAKRHEVKLSLNYPHMCKNFEKVKAWTEERLLDHMFQADVYVEDDLPPPTIIY